MFPRSVMEVVIVIKKLFGSSSLLKKYTPADVETSINMPMSKMTSSMTMNITFEASIEVKGWPEMLEMARAAIALSNPVIIASTNICMNSFLIEETTHHLPFILPSWSIVENFDDMMIP